jgi:pimeloyl-ACP methyl ester carboxylesterase
MTNPRPTLRPPTASRQRPDVVKRRKPSDEAAAPAQAVDPPAADGGGYAPALNAGFQATTARVQEIHQAISGKTFDSLGLVPGLSVPTRIVQGVHDAITQGVYAAVRHGGLAALSIAGGAEWLASDPNRIPGTKERVLRSALNGAVGDALAASGSALAVQMRLQDRNGAQPLTRVALTALRPRVCVFLHGLGCDEQSWRLRTDAWATSPWADALPPCETIQYGALLEREHGDPDISALWLRYNSGLAIDHNAQQLADLLDRVAQAAPQVHEWLLIGHSMGGLVARRAQALAAEQGLAWARKVPMIVCLGSPHQGAPLAKFGQITAAALAVSEVTRPLARIANARSRGIKDLRHGLKGATAGAGGVDPPALRLVFATLGDEEGGGIGKWVGSLLGDGLVRSGSAADDGLVGDVQRVELPGLGHMGLLNHPRVYAVIREWLGAPAG